MVRDINCEYFKENILPEHLQLWEAWKEASHDYLFNEEVTKLFGLARTGLPNFIREEINDIKSDIMQNILKLREFKISVESLNDFLLEKKIGDNVPDALQQPKVSKRQRLKVVVCAGGADNGCYTARCQAVWHAVHTRDFWLLFSTTTAADNAVVNFVKQMLRENEWMDCMPANCTLHLQTECWCPMPMEQFCCDTMVMSNINGHDVPVFQVEVAGEKGTNVKDDKKICLISAWNLCFASKTYGMEVGKDSATIIKMENNRETGVINCSKFPVDLNGSSRGGKIFQQLLKLVCMIVAAMHDVTKQETEMYDTCTTLLHLGKVKLGNKIHQKHNENIGEGCFFYIFHTDDR